MRVSYRIPTMINNPWINRAAAIVLLLCVYIAGVDAGRERAAEAHQNQPACQRLN
jgi:hypothetical protein